jgi:hypothetical protein
VSRRLLRPLVVGLAILAATAPAGAATSRVFRASGIVVHYPSGWFASNRPLNAWTNPIQRFVVSSYRVPGGRPNLDGSYSPPPGGVVAELVEQQAPGPNLAIFRLRPTRFALPHLTNHMEGFGDHWGEVGFREHRRVFAIFIGVGEGAPAERVTTLLRSLDTMVIRT